MVCWPRTDAQLEVINVAKDRNLDNTIVSSGLPPADTSQIRYYLSMDGIGTCYHDLLIPTMDIISRPWSLWAPSFGGDAIDYERLRLRHMAIGDVILGLSQ